MEAGGKKVAINKTPISHHEARESQATESVKKVQINEKVQKFFEADSAIINKQYTQETCSDIRKRWNSGQGRMIKECEEKQWKSPFRKHQGNSSQLEPAKATLRFPPPQPVKQMQKISAEVVDVEVEITSGDSDNSDDMPSLNYSSGEEKDDDADVEVDIASFTSSLDLHEEENEENESDSDNSDDMPSLNYSSGEEKEDEINTPGLSSYGPVGVGDGLTPRSFAGVINPDDDAYWRKLKAVLDPELFMEIRKEHIHHAYVVLKQADAILLASKKAARKADRRKSKVSDDEEHQRSSDLDVARHMASMNLDNNEPKLVPNHDPHSGFKDGTSNDDKICTVSDCHRHEQILSDSEEEEKEDTPLVAPVYGPQTKSVSDIASWLASSIPTASPNYSPLSSCNDDTPEEAAQWNRTTQQYERYTLPDKRLDPTLQTDDEEKLGRFMHPPKENELWTSESTQCAENYRIAKLPGTYRDQNSRKHTIPERPDSEPKIVLLKNKRQSRKSILM